MNKYLRSTTNGMIFEWDARLTRYPEFEELTEQQAYPERFAPVDLAKREITLDISVPKEVVTPPVEIAPELLVEASKPFGKGKDITEPKQKKKQTTANFAGLAGEI